MVQFTFMFLESGYKISILFMEGGAFSSEGVQS